MPAGCAVNAINNRGLIVGTQHSDEWLFGHGTLWRDGVVYRFRKTFDLVDVNDAGTFVSSNVEGHGVPNEAYVWKVRR